MAQSVRGKNKHVSLLTIVRLDTIWTVLIYVDSQLASHFNQCCGLEKVFLLAILLGILNCNHSCHKTFTFFACLGIEGGRIEIRVELNSFVFGIVKYFATLHQELASKLLLGRNVKRQDTRLGWVPSVGDRCQTHIEVLGVVLEHGSQFHQTITVDLALMGERNLNVSDKANSDGNLFFAHNSVKFSRGVSLQGLVRPLLHNLVL